MTKQRLWFRWYEVAPEEGLAGMESIHMVQRGGLITRGLAWLSELGVPWPRLSRIIWMPSAHWQVSKLLGSVKSLQDVAYYIRDHYSSSALPAPRQMFQKFWVIETLSQWLCYASSNGSNVLSNWYSVLTFLLNIIDVTKPIEFIENPSVLNGLLPHHLSPMIRKLPLFTCTSYQYHGFCS